MKQSKMKIKKLVILAIRGSTDIRNKLKEALDISDTTLYRLLYYDSEDLTKAAAMRVIREELNLTDDQILEETEQKVG